jgi:uncharacterized protein YndB with AHSA1/START domain
MSEAIKPFVIEKTFHATPAQLYAALTEPDALGQWMGPKGCVLSVAKLEPHPGGIFLYSMHMPGGVVMWGRWIFEEMEPPHRLVVQQSFSDENGGVTVHPMSATWPRVTHSVSTLTEQGDQTTLRLEWTPYQASQVEIDTFAAAHDGMRMGWTGTFEQLELYLAANSKAA